MVKDYYLIVKLTNKCNMKCPYCYHMNYTENTFRNNDTMSKNIVEIVIKKLLSNNYHSAHFTWHGGEPLLLGLDMFEFIVACQKRNNTKGLKIFNRVQTNGILLNEEFIDFFKKNDFHIGISIDGPGPVHSKNRNCTLAQFQKTVSAIKEAEKQKARMGVLTVIGKHNVNKPNEIYNFFCDNSIHNVSFLPCIVTKNNKIDEEKSIEPQGYGRFLCSFFDVWRNGSIIDMRIKNFDEIFRYKLKMQPLACINNNLCDEFLTITPEGQIFLCDNFSPGADSFVGSIYEDFADFYKKENIKTLVKNMNVLPSKCQKCTLLDFCNSGCKYYRYIVDSNMKKEQYFCLSTKMLYSHINKILGVFNYDLLLQH